MSDVAAIQGWMSSVQSTMTGLPDALAAAAPSDGFAAVLDSARALLDNTPGATGAGAPTAALTSSGAATSSGVPAGPPSGAAVASEAEKFLGVPYLFGGTTPSGFDCSGLVQYVYGQLGVSLPRTSEQQATVGTPVASLANAQPGDLVFYAGTDGTPSSPGHVGIYVGNGEMIDAPYSGAAVRLDPVGTPVAIRRVLSGAPLSPPALAPLFDAASAATGVPASLLSAVANVESGGSPNAVSSAGAEGLMQLMPGTAAQLGVNPFDPAQAITGAARLLSGEIQHFGSLSAALAAYNAGAGAVTQAGGVAPSGQTAAYVQDVLQQAGLSGQGSGSGS